MALITGILRDPANKPMAGVNISLHALETSQIVLNTVVASETTAADGRYTMQVPAGFYSVSLNKTGQRSAQVGKFRVYDDSPSGDLNTFLKAPLTALTPEWFTRIEDERKKAEAQAADARASKLAAQSAVKQASDIAAQSQAHANQAKAEADRAAQVAGLDTVNEAVAAALGGQHVFAQNEVGMAVMRAMNLQRFAASGFVHWGMHLERNFINQGMWSYIDSNSSNKLYLGLATSNPAAANVVSPTRYPVIHMAGFISKLRYFNNTNEDQARILLPDAPDGTVVYDRATGKVINFKTEVDPKYGDVAATHNEAVSRAFEGLIKNGDFRYGLDYWKGKSGMDVTVENGVLKFARTQETGDQYALYESFPVKLNETYELELVVEQLPVDGPLGVEVAYNLNEPHQTSYYHTTGVHRLKFTPTLDATTCDIRFRSSTTVGDVAGVSYVSVRPASQQIVTNRVDMFGIEGFLRKIQPGNYVYPNGLIQSKATSMNGIATSDETALPDSYFAVYQGDTSSRGLGVDFHARSVIEQDALTADPDHNISRLNDGTVVQWCIRQRSFAGPGDGLWSGASPDETPAASFDGKSLVRPQGDTVFDKAFTNASPYFYAPSVNQFKNVHGSMHGVFGASNYYGGQGQLNGELGVNGLCFFVTMGTVSRLNQGAYHVTLNPLGTRSFADDDGSRRVGWASSDLRITPNKLKDCFQFAEEDSPYPFVDGIVYGRFSTSTEGSLAVAAGATTRPDDRRYDGVYPDGIGGVVDYRKSAHDMGSSEHASVIRKQIEAGLYRGREKVLVNNRISISQYGSDVQTTYITHVQNTGHRVIGESESLIFHNGYVYQCWPHSNDYWFQIRRYIDGVPVPGDYRADIDLNVPFYIVPKGNVDMESFSQASIFNSASFINVSGNFNLVEVTGNPNELIKIPVLKNGWCGIWNPTRMDGNTKKIIFSRKSVRGLGDSHGSRQYTTDQGMTWSGSTLSFTSAVENGYTSSHPANHVQINFYQAFAKQTKPVQNRSVRNGLSGISGSVYVSNIHAKYNGSLLGDSLLGIINTGQHDPAVQSVSVNSVMLNGANGELNDFSPYWPTHSPITISGSSSGGFKVLSYQPEQGDVATLDFCARQLLWDETAGDWGDSASKVPIFKLDGTITDDNGHTVKVARHTLAIPYGYTKINS